MEISSQELDDVRHFIDLLNLQTKSVVVVEGKRDAKALRRLGFTGKIMEFHHYNGLIKFADKAAKHDNLIMLLDGDRKGRYLTARLIENLSRRTKIDLSFKKRLVSITKGRVRFIEQMISYESLI